MTRLRGPAPDSWSFLLVGGAFKSAGGLTGVAYAGLTGSTLADIRVDDGTDTPGLPIPGSAVTIDSATSAPPQFWYPDGDVSVVYMSVNGGPRTPVYANYDPRINAKVGKGDLFLNVKDFGAVGSGLVDDTAAINAALAAATTGTTVLFPQPTAHYKITGPLTPPAGVTVAGAGRGCEIRQYTQLKPVFDLFNVDDCTVRGFTLTLSGGPLNTVGSSFRGDAGYDYCAGVWTNGSRHTISDLRIVDFAVGVYLSSTNGTTLTSTPRTGNTVRDLEISGFNFGILFLAQNGLHITGLYCHDDHDSSAGVNPTHAIYATGGGASGAVSTGVVVSDCTSTTIVGGAAYQFKFCNGLAVTNMHADGCLGLFSGIDLQDMVASTLTSRNDQTTGTFRSFWIQKTATQPTRLNISNVSIQMATDGQPMVVIGDNVRMSNVSIYSNHTGAATESYDVQLRGDNITADGLRITNLGSVQYRAVTVGAAGTPTSNVTIAGLEVTNAKSLVDWHTSITGANGVEYSPGSQRNIGFRTTNYIDELSGTASYTVARRPWTSMYTVSGGGTVYPLPAMETVTLFDVTDSTGFTIHQPTIKPKVGMTQDIIIRNNSGGSLGTISWHAIYTLAGTFLAPPAGSAYRITFGYDGGNWRELSRTAAAAVPATGVMAHLSTAGDSIGATMIYTGATGVTPANNAIVVRVVPKRDITVAVLTWISTTQSGNYDIALLDSAGTRLWSKGATAWPAAGTINETVSPSVAMTAGQTYYVAFAADNTTGQLRGLSGTADFARLLDGTYGTRTGTSLYPIPSSVTLGSLAAIGRLPIVVLREA